MPLLLAQERDVLRGGRLRAEGGVPEARHRGGGLACRDPTLERGGGAGWIGWAVLAAGGNIGQPARMHMRAFLFVCTVRKIAKENLELSVTVNKPASERSRRKHAQSHFLPIPKIQKFVLNQDICILQLQRGLKRANQETGVCAFGRVWTGIYC